MVKMKQFQYWLKPSKILQLRLTINDHLLFFLSFEIQPHDLDETNTQLAEMYEMLQLCFFV